MARGRECRNVRRKDDEDVIPLCHVYIILKEKQSELFDNVYLS